MQAVFFEYHNAHVENTFITFITNLGASVSSSLTQPQTKSFAFHKLHSVDYC